MAFLRKLTQSLTISVGLFVVVGALAVFLRPVLWPSVRPDVLHRLARIPLLIVGSGAWGILCVAIARKARWPAPGGAALAVMILSVAYFAAILISPNPSAWGGLSLAVWLFCRKVLYSESEWNAVAPVEQLTSLHLNS